MITKGTKEYKAAQALANDIVAFANTSKNDRHGWELYGDALMHFCIACRKLDNFASKIAETVMSTINNGMYVARISDKQAWIMACAAVENGIEL